MKNSVLHFRYLATIKHPAKYLAQYLAKFPVALTIALTMAFTFLNSTLLPARAMAVETVDSVDLAQYLGKWYEIASIPASFQRKCIKNVTAEYKLLDYGKIDVVNSCVKKDSRKEVANGIAQVVNDRTHAELKVSFVPFFNHFGWFAGQYKILALDSNYQYSLVGEDKLEYGWILSRTPILDKEILVELEKEIRRLGYDSCRFKTTLQDGGAFSERRPLCDIVKE